MTNPEIRAPDTAEPEKPKLGGTGVGPGRRRKALKKRRVVWVLLGLVVIGAAGILLYRHFAAWQSTDDAQIDGYIYPVSSRITGYVNRVMVDDNQYVEAGTVLVELDSKDYTVARANAAATLANDQATAASVATNVPITSVSTSSQLSSAQASIDNAKAGLIAAQRQSDAAQASLRQAEANDLKAQDDVNRVKPLAAKDEISQQQYVQAVDTQKGTAAAVQSAQAVMLGRRFSYDDLQQSQD